MTYSLASPAKARRGAAGNHRPHRHAVGERIVPMRFPHGVQRSGGAAHTENRALRRASKRAAPRRCSWRYLDWAEAISHACKAAFSPKINPDKRGNETAHQISPRRCKYRQPCNETLTHTLSNPLSCRPIDMQDVLFVVLRALPRRIGERETREILVCRRCRWVRPGFEPCPLETSEGLANPPTPRSYPVELTGIEPVTS